MMVTGSEMGCACIAVKEGARGALVVDVRAVPSVVSAARNIGPAPAVNEGVRRGLTADEWAIQQFAQVELGDKRLTQRAVQMATLMVAHPEASLPEQMGSRAALEGSYRLLNNARVKMETLLAPQREQTLAAARQQPLVLMVEDTTELDYSAHRSKTGLGPIGDGRGRGLLLHSTLAVEPTERQVLGLAHAQVVVRQAVPKGSKQRRHTEEGQVWEVSAKSVGRPPEGVLWVHVSDRESDVFSYMAACVDEGKQFLVRAFQNRVLEWDGEVEPLLGEPTRYLLDYARSLPAREEGGYRVEVAARKSQPARQAEVVLQWAPIKIKPAAHAPLSVRHHAPIAAWVLRVWEPNPPEGAEAVEWILLSSLPITTVVEAHRAVAWYTCRWLVEDYHMCLKTGCRVEETQLDDAADIRRLLGFCCPIAVRLLQLRQAVRSNSEVAAMAVVDPLMVEMLTLRRPKLSLTMTIGQFWQAVSGLGGHQGRRSDGPPGWRTLWRGWCKLSDLTEGARLVRRGHPLEQTF